MAIGQAACRRSGVSHDEAFARSQAFAMAERAAFVELVDWAVIPGAQQLAGVSVRNGCAAVQWCRGNGRRRYDAWASIVDREVVGAREAAAGHELMRIVQEMSCGGGLGGRNLYAPRVDASLGNPSASRDRLVGLYHGRFLPWLQSTWRRPAKLVPNKAAHRQAEGAVIVSVVLLVLVFGASLRAIDGKAGRRAGTARDYLAEGLSIYANQR